MAGKPDGSEGVTLRLPEITPEYAMPFVRGNSNVIENKSGSPSSAAGTFVSNPVGVSAKQNV